MPCAIYAYFSGNYSLISQNPMDQAGDVCRLAPDEGHPSHGYVMLMKFLLHSLCVCLIERVDDHKCVMKPFSRLFGDPRTHIPTTT